MSGLAATVRERFPTLDMLIANAGISTTEDMRSDTWEAAAARSVLMAASSALAFVPRVDPPAKCPSLSGYPMPLACGIGDEACGLRRIVPVEHTTGQGRA